MRLSCVSDILEHVLGGLALGVLEFIVQVLEHDANDLNDADQQRPKRQRAHVVPAPAARTHVLHTHSQQQTCRHMQVSMQTSRLISSWLVSTCMLLRYYRCAGMTYPVASKVVTQGYLERSVKHMIYKHHMTSCLAQHFGNVVLHGLHLRVKLYMEEKC